MTEPSGRLCTVAELARRLGVPQSTVSRALDAADRHQHDPPPPRPERDDLGRPYYPADQFLAWWPHRRGIGRPTDTTPGKA